MSIFIRYEAINTAVVNSASAEMTAAKEHFAGSFDDEKALKEYCRQKQDVGIECCLFVCVDLERLQETAALITEMKSDHTLNVLEMKLVIYFSEGCEKALIEEVVSGLDCIVFLVYGKKRQEIFEFTAAKERFGDLSQVCIVESAEYSPENINLSNIFYTYYLQNGHTPQAGVSASSANSHESYDKDAVKTELDEYVAEKYKILEAANYSFLNALANRPYNIDIKSTPFDRVPPDRQYDAFVKKYGQIIDSLIAHNVGFERNTFALKFEKDFTDTLLDTYSRGKAGSIIGNDEIELYNAFLSDLQSFAKDWADNSDLCLNDLRKTNGGSLEATDKDGEYINLKSLKAYSNWLRDRFITKYIKLKMAETKLQTYPLIEQQVLEKKRDINSVINSRVLTPLEAIFAVIITNGSFVHNVVAAIRNRTRSGGDVIINEFRSAKPGFCTALLFITSHLAGNTAQAANLQNFLTDIINFINSQFVMKALLPNFTDITSIRSNFTGLKEREIVIAPDECPLTIKAALNHAEDFKVKSFCKYNIISIPSSNINGLLQLISV